MIEGQHDRRVIFKESSDLSFLLYLLIYSSDQYESAHYLCLTSLRSDSIVKSLSHFFPTFRSIWILGLNGRN